MTEQQLITALAEAALAWYSARTPRDRQRVWDAFATAADALAEMRQKR